MDAFFEPFQEMLITLNSFEIEYLLIGGYAINFMVIIAQQVI